MLFISILAWLYALFDISSSFNAYKSLGITGLLIYIELSLKVAISMSLFITIFSALVILQLFSTWFNFNSFLYVIDFTYFNVLSNLSLVNVFLSILFKFSGFFNKIE